MACCTRAGPTAVGLPLQKIPHLHVLTHAIQLLHSCCSLLLDGPQLPGRLHQLPLLLQHLLLVSSHLPLQGTRQLLLLLPALLVLGAQRLCCCHLLLEGIRLLLQQLASCFGGGCGCLGCCR
jgi:hypothetical protein